jgi:hypothetical protein
MVHIHSGAVAARRVHEPGRTTLTQRKCGTCRYFEEGGIAASGWCRHPLRQDLQHMVLVRKTELACRKDWDNDLWEATGEAVPSADQDVELVNAARSTPPASKSVGSPGLDAAHPPRQGTSRVMGRLFDDESDDFVIPRQPASRESAGTPARSEQPGGPAFQRSGDAGARRGSGDSRSPGGRDLSNAWGSGLNALGRPREESPVPDGPKAEPARGSVERGADPEKREPPTPRPAPPTAPMSPPGAAGRFGAMAAEFVTESPRGPVPQSGRTEPIELPVDELEDDDALDVEEYEPEVSESDSRAGGEAEAKGEHPSIELLERCCRSCRDFLPTENGGRGMCNNAYALTKGQLVDPDDLACQGTFGNWWAPSDDWWRARADISHHYAPTPLVDELVTEIRARHAHGNPKGSTQRRSRP